MQITEHPLSERKIAIVTGGSRGLGRNTVLNLAKRSVSSIFTYNSNRAEADKVVAASAEAGSKATALQLDTQMSAPSIRLWKDVSNALGELGAERFDYLVTTPGPHITPHSKRRRRRSWTASTMCTSRACSSSRRSCFRLSTTAGAS